MPNNQNKPISGFTSLNVATGNELILAMLTGTTVNLTLDTAKDYIISEMPDGAPITGGTYSNGSVIFTNSTGGTFSVTGFTLDNYSLSDLGFLITSLSGATIDRDITLPENSYITYQSPLVVDGGYTLIVPPSSEFDIVNDRLGTTTTASTTNNISDAIYTVNNDLNANNTSTATTSVMVYGVNVFTGVTTTNYATKLPQPVTGKSVKVINNGKTFLYVFPSNIGGQVNGLPIDTPAIIPPDGNLYEFICIKNPLPGVWTWSAPATGQYDSGEITMSATSIGMGQNPVVTAIDSSTYGMIESFFTGTVSYNGKNKPAKQISPSFIINGSNPYYRALFFRPDTPWKGITKIKMYTNLIPVIVDEDEISYGEIRLMGSGYYNGYIPSTGQLVGAYENSTSELFRTSLQNRIDGTAVSASTIYTSANIGDPGTIWGERVVNTGSGSNGSIGSDVEGPFIGNKSIETKLYSGTNPYLQGEMIERYYASYISFQFDLLPFINYGTIPDFKFRFVIEYFQ